jgi:hypothetical protein
LPTTVIAEVIREDLGALPGELFASFETEPLGSASIGQVHAAQLFDGRLVVVKVRKPGVDTLVRLDSQILADLVDAWYPRFPVLEQFDARGLVREFSDTMLGELDLRREAANEKLFHDAFSKEPGSRFLSLSRGFRESAFSHSNASRERTSAISRTFQNAAGSPSRSGSRASYWSLRSNAVSFTPTRILGIF